MITTRAELLQSLKRQLRQISGVELAAGEEVEVVSTGVAAMDGLLPQGGVPRGGLVEWLTAGDGAGGATVALAGVRAALKQSGYWVVIDPQGEFYPPAALGWGIPAGRLLLVRPATPRDAAWAFEQALRCPGVAVTWNWVGSVSERVLQRWKVAAEVGRGQGVLFRSDRALRQASWADVRWLVEPIRPIRQIGPIVDGRNRGAYATPVAGFDQAIMGNGRRLRLELAYCRGVLGGARVEVECDDETGLVRVVPQLADSTHPRRAARA